MSKSKRRNPIAQDLMTEKYRQRREKHIKVKKREQEEQDAKQQIRDYKKDLPDS